MDNSKEFIEYLSNKFKVSEDEALVNILQTIGQDRIKKEYEIFQVGIESMKQGGKFDYIKCLQAFKKGGKMKCGCGAKMEQGKKIPKAFLGAILGKLGGASGTLGAAGQASGIMDKLSKVGGGISNVAGNVEKIIGAFNAGKTRNIPMMPSQTVGMINPSQLPETMQPVTSTNEPKLQQRSIPQVKMQEGGEIKKDSKLEKLKALKALKKKPAKN